MEKNIEDAIALCLEIQNTMDQWKSYGIHRHIAREKPVHPWGTNMSAPYPCLIYSSPTTPFFLRSEGIIKIIDNFWMAPLDPRPIGLYYIEVNFNKMNKWLKKYLPAEVNRVKENSKLTISKREVKKQINDLIKQGGFTDNEVALLKLLSDFEEHRTNEISQNITKHYRQLKSLLNKKLKKEGWIIPDAKTGGFKAGYYHLEHLTVKIE